MVEMAAGDIGKGQKRAQKWFSCFYLMTRRSVKKRIIIFTRWQAQQSVFFTQ